MPSRLLYQMVASARKRDAVGRMALGVHRLALREGHRSLIFTERQGGWPFCAAHKGLLKESPAWGRLTAAPPAISIYHHSTGSVGAERFLTWPAEKRVLLYHNITPPELLESPSAEHARLGREQLRKVAGAADLAVGFSELSCDELGRAGAKRIELLPYYLWGRKFSPEVRTGVDMSPLVLVVGRVARHKGVLESARAFLALRDRIPTARLRILGNCTADPTYVAEIRRLDPAIEIKGKVSDRALVKAYGEAAALLTLSSHEGFCVPLVEAMRAGVPIVAFPAAAIPETLGRGGLLVKSRDPEVVAESLQKAISDPPTREAIRRAQQTEHLRFAPERFERPFIAALERL